MIALGATEISKVHLGSDELSKVCLGSTELWSANSKIKNYLKFTAIEDSIFQYTQPLEYSTDNGNTWETLAAGTETPTIQAGNSILWRGTYTPSNTTNNFTATGKFTASGNPKSIWAGNNFEDALLVNYAYKGLFYNCTQITDASGLTMNDQEVTIACCNEMFRGCTNLITPPSLPAMTLAANCYNGMFRGCTNLASAPTLPATTLYRSCYDQMFRDCKELTTAPDLQALSLAQTCYYYMFAGCTKLNYIKALFTSIGTNSIASWVLNVASTGTFVKNANATWTTTGGSGVPNGWTVILE